MPFKHMSYSRTFSTALFVQVGKKHAHHLDPKGLSSREQINECDLVTYQNIIDPFFLNEINLKVLTWIKLMNVMLKTVMCSVTSFI